MTDEVKLRLLSGEDPGSSSEVELYDSSYRKDDASRPRYSALKKEINTLTAIAYLIGCIIGSGIFITPRNVLLYTRSFGLSMIVWLLGGVVASLGALCYIELALVVKKSGADYSYLKEIYSFKRKHWVLDEIGSVLAFSYCWSFLWIVRPSGLAIVCLTSARYLVRPFYITCEEIPAGNAVTFLALSILVIISLVNCFGLKFATRMMSVFTACKLFTVAFIMVLGVVSIGVYSRDLPRSFSHPFEFLEGKPPSLFSVALSFYSVMFTYDGWNSLGYTVEETKNVKRTLPLAVYVSLSVVIVSYIIINIGFFAILSLDQIENTEAVALPFAKETLGTAGLVIMSLLASASSFGSANGSIFKASRELFVSAREGQTPAVLSELHVTAKTPVPAIVLTVRLRTEDQVLKTPNPEEYFCKKLRHWSLFAMVCIVAGTIDTLLQGLEFVSIFFTLLNIIGVLILRVTHKQQPRIFKAVFIVPIALVTTVFMLLLCILPTVQSPIPPLVTTCAVLTALPVYVVFIKQWPSRSFVTFISKYFNTAAKPVSLILNTEPAKLSSAE